MSSEVASHTTPYRFAACTAAYAVLTGALSLVGWYADIPRLTDWVGSGISMFVNTSVMAVMVGVAMLLLLSARNLAIWTGAAIGCALSIIGGAIVFQHITGIDLGIDTLLFANPWGERAAVSPGRPGPPAAVSFTLIGIALALSPPYYPHRRRYVPGLGLAVFAIALVGILGYLFHADPLFATARFTGIALQTASVLAAVGLGLAASVPEQEPCATLLRNTSGGLLTRRTLPVIVVLPIVLAWVRTLGEDAGLYDTGTGRALLVLSFILMSCALLWWCKIAVEKQEEGLRAGAAQLERRVEDRTHQLERQTEQLRRLAVQLTEVEDRERKRLAQILHDHLQQLLVAAKMRLQNPELANAASIREAQQLIEQAYEASRSLTSELRPPVLYEGGLVPALRFLVRKFQDQHEFLVRFSASADAEPISPSNKTMLYQTVRELLTNAVNYSEVLECDLSIERTQDESIRVVVHDRGIGFDAAKIGAETSRGFGLFSIRERVRALGGTWTVISAAGQGARFEVTIPDAREHALETTPARRKDDVVPDDQVEKARKEGAITVLIADDHRIVRQSIATTLQSQSFIHEVLQSENGRDAVDLAQLSHPDIVLMDLNMPVMDGIEATRVLHQSNPEIKIIGLSVQTEQETAQAMKDAGAVMYLNKGEDINILIKALRDLAGPFASAN